MGQQVPDAVVRAQASAYFFFARLFREAPAPELLREIVQQRLLTLAGQRGESEAGRAEDPRWPTQVEEIAADYARLFAVPGEQALHPYESAYCDTLTVDVSAACSPYFESDPPIGGLPGFLRGPSSVAVLERYRQAGLEPDPACHELPDHIAMELEFMSWLLARGRVEEAAVFFTEHLGRWAFRCLERVAEKTTSSFYRAAADSLAAFLHHERRIPEP